MTTQVSFGDMRLLSYLLGILSLDDDEVAKTATATSMLSLLAIVSVGMKWPCGTMIDK